MLLWEVDTPLCEVVMPGGDGFWPVDRVPALFGEFVVLTVLVTVLLGNTLVAIAVPAMAAEPFGTV